MCNAASQLGAALPLVFLAIMLGHVLSLLVAPPKVAAVVGVGRSEFGLSCWVGGPSSLTLLLEHTAVMCGTVTLFIVGLEAF